VVISNHRKLLWSKAMVVNVAETIGVRLRDFRQHDPPLRGPLDQGGDRIHTGSG
jgi:hypothetical protein